MINGSKVADHALWKADCASNSCADQAGNWLFPRAGWCPGQEVIPAIFNTTDVASSGQSITVDYELQDYTNLLNTGYNNSGHTEPHYRIHGVMVEESDDFFMDYKNLVASFIGELVAPPNSEHHITVTNNGNVDVEDFVVNLFSEGELIATLDYDEINNGPVGTNEGATIIFDEAILPAGVNNIIAEVVSAGDMTPGDNIIAADVEGPTSTEDLVVLSSFSINPNPTNSNIQIQFEEDLLGGQMVLYSIDGRMITKRNISNATESISVDLIGTYFLKAINKDGHTASKKVVVID